MFGDFGKVGKAVTVLMGLAGGVLLDMAPPAHYLADEPGRAKVMSHGVASLFVFVLYFFISAAPVVKRAASRDAWFRRGMVMFIMGTMVLITYVTVRGEFVVDTRGEEYLVGLWRNREWINANEGKDWVNWSNKRLFERTSWGYPYEEVWLSGSRMAAYALLQVLYVLGICGLYGAVFCLWAGVYGRRLSHCRNCVA